jgi:hypothetical protein
MTLETYKKRFKLPFEYLKYVADPKMILGANDKVYRITINKKGLPVAHQQMEQEEMAAIVWPKSEIINFT